MKYLDINKDILNNISKQIVIMGQGYINNP